MRARKVDQNQSEIVAYLRAFGLIVFDTTCRGWITKLCTQAKRGEPVAIVTSLTEARMLIINGAPVGTRLHLGSGK